MSIQRLDQGLDPHGTDLISRLANSLYQKAGGVSASPAAVTDGGPGNGRDIALSGGFPSASSPGAPPPVHPTVVGAEPLPVAKNPAPPTGSHHPDDPSSHEFGEPSFYGQSIRERAPSGAVAELEPPKLSAGEPLSTAADFYFLQNRGLPALASVPFGPGFSSGGASQPFDIQGIRKDFPALQQRVNGRQLVWLDNAATTHKPQSVIDATSLFYSRDNSNIHRAAHALAERATRQFEDARETVRQFLGAESAKEIVFLRGTTEAINLVAGSWGKQNIGEGDEIVLSQLEHHANIVPWQLLADQVGARLRVIPMNDRGELLIEELPKLLNDRTKIVSVAHVSNSLGTINPIEEIIAIAHARGIPVLVDGAQSVPHFPINVRALDADFFVFSGHKIFGPTGIGVLYGKSHLLESMPPWQGGGHMIEDVTFGKTVFRAPPEKFEAGTPDIAGVVGLAAAIDYLTGLGIPALAAYEHSLLEYAEEALGSIRGVRRIGTAARKASVFGFVIPGVPNDRIANELDRQGIAVRAGHHCALPALRHFGVENTVRPSLAFYNTREDVDALIHALHRIPR